MATLTDIQKAAIERINAEIKNIDTAIETITLSGSYSADNGQQMTQADLEKLRDLKSAKLASLKSICKRAANA